MNGQRLGVLQSKINKNSFAFDNEFIDYAQNSSQSYQQSSQQQIYQNQKKQNQKRKESSNKDSSQIESDVIKKSDILKKSQIQKSEIKDNDKNIEKKSDKETKKISKINKDISQLSVSILELKSKYNDLDMQQVMFKKRNQKKQAQIKQYLDQKKKQRKQRKVHQRQRRKKDKKKLQEEVKIQEQNEKRKIKDRIESQMRQLIRQKQRKKQQKQKQQQKYRLVEHMYDKIHAQQQKKKKFYIRKQQQDKKKRLKQKKQDQEYLKKRKQNYKPLDIDQLQDFQKKHQDKKAQILAVKRAEKEKEYLSILEQNDKFEKIYRGQSYDYVQEQLEERKNKRKQPKQRYKKIKNYQQYVRENFVPRTHQKSLQNSLQIENKKQNRSALSHRQVKKYRFLQGVAIGQIIQNRPIAKSEAEQRNIGNQYFDYMKNLPKKKKVQQQTQIGNNDDLQLLDQKLNQIVRVKREKNNPLYERSRKKNLDIKVSDKPTRDQVNMVIDQLKGQDQKMRMKEKLVKNQVNNAQELSFKRKQINNQMVDNIQRKLNLLAKLAA